MANLLQRFKSAYSAFTFSPSSVDLDTLREEGQTFIPIASSGNTFNDLQLLKDRTEIPEVGAIVTMKARAFSNMKLRIVSRTTGKDIEPVDMPNREYYIKVLRDPNWFQSIKEFLMQTKDFRETFGEEIIYLNKPFGVDSLRSKAMFTLPPYLIETETPDKSPFYLQLEPNIKYKFKWNNRTYEVDKENTIHLTSNRVDMSCDNWVRGESWIRLNKACVNNIRSAYEARGVLIENRGALGIFVNKSAGDMGTLPFDDKAQKELNKKMQMYGVTKGKRRFIFAPNNLGFEKISIDNPANLGLFEEIQADFNKLCDSAGVNSGLFSNEKGSTFENQKQYKLSMYQDTIVPEAEEWLSALNSFFGTDSKSWIIIGTYDHLPVFSENIKEKGLAMKLIADALNVMIAGGLVTQEEAREQLRKLGIAVPK